MVERVNQATLPEDQELICQSKEGNSEAYAQLFSRYKDRLRNYLSVRVGPENAQDLLQDIFLKSWQAVPDYEIHPEAPFDHWLMTITRNHWIDTLRRQNNQKQRPLKETAQLTEDQPLPEAGFKHNLEEITAILHPRLREVFMLRHQQHLSVAETAQALGTTEGVVKVRSTRARHIVEDKFLKPRGIEKVARIAKRYQIAIWVYREAIVGNKLRAFKLFDHYYTSEAIFDDYTKKYQKRGVDSNLLDSSFILLSALNIYEYNKLQLESERWGVTRHNGRLNISQENYLRFLARLRKQSTQRFRPTDSRFQPIAAFTSNVGEYSRLNRAVRTGKLPGQKVRRFWFTTQEAIGSYLKSKGQS